MRRLTGALLLAMLGAPALAHAAEPTDAEPGTMLVDPSAPSETGCVARDPEGWQHPVHCQSGRPLERGPHPQSPGAAEPAPDQPTKRLASEPPKGPNTVIGKPPADEPEDDDCFACLPCVIVPHPGCGTQAHVELGMGWGESHSYVGWQWSYRGFVEAGMLVGLHRDFQLGPVFELGFDTGRVNSGFTASTKLKSRYWIAGWYIALDTAFGGAFEHFTFDGGTENGTRYGPTSDVAVTVHGVAGPYFGFSQLGSVGGAAEWESRLLVGFRASLAGWGLLLWPLGEAMKSPMIL